MGAFMNMLVNFIFFLTTNFYVVLYYYFFPLLGIIIQFSSFLTQEVETTGTGDNVPSSC